jgi:hypothetical protein
VLACCWRLALVDAVEREVLQRGELGLDPV